MKKKILLLTLLFFVKFGFAQNTVTYSSLNNTININSGVEGTSDVVISCFGSSGTPVVLNIPFLCGNPDGYISYLASNGLSLLPGNTTTLKFKFKKTVATDTQIVYKFSTNGSCFQDESKMIKITVNYKASTSPTNPTGPSTNNTIGLVYANQFVTYVGQYDRISIYGSYSPSYTYEWQSKTEGGVWTTIPGETGQTFTLMSPSVSISLKRIVRNALGAYLSESNIVDIKVYPLLKNNTISLSGSNIEGSIPTGGIGNGAYDYSWDVYVLEGEDPWVFNTNSRNFTVPASVYNFIGSNKAYVRRIVRSGEQISISNTVVVNPSQDIGNNIISILESSAVGYDVIGSVPTGGTGSFTYEYYAYNELNGEVIEEVRKVGNDRDFYQPNIGALPLKFYRKVYSGNKISYSNIVTILPTKEITNNTITLSGNNSTGFNIIGSNPIGGRGLFRYEYYAYNELNGEVIEEVKKVGNDRDFYQPSIGALPLKFYRKVYSGNKVSFSNIVTILPVGSFAKMPLKDSIISFSDLTLYPNPASESVNFATNFSTDKEIEILLYSENLGNENSVFKGKVVPNQVVNWNIPSNYQKGLYFYKIISDNKEVKTGKIIFK